MVDFCSSKITTYLRALAQPWGFSACGSPLARLPSMWNRMEIARRRQLLLTWLAPAGTGPEAGRLVGRPQREIAEALRGAFPGKSIGTTSVQRFLADLRRDGQQPDLGTRKRGRPRAATLPADAVSQVHLWCEALALTGLDRLSLYRLLSTPSGTGLCAPSRSSFYAELAKFPTHSGRTVAQAGHPGDYQAEEHVLRLHQIDLIGPAGAVRSVALAYDIRTRYVCARFCVFTQADTAKRRGRPVRKFEGGPQPVVREAGQAPGVYYPAAWWWDFAEEVAARMKLPVAGLVLSGGVRDATQLVADLAALQPDGGYEASATGPQVLSVRAGSPLSDAEFGTGLAAALNRYNQAVALPLIDKARRRQADLEHRQPASETDLFMDWMQAAISSDPEKLRAVEARNEAVRAEDRLAEEVRTRLSLERWKPFKGTYITGDPLRYEVGAPKKMNG